MDPEPESPPPAKREPILPPSRAYEPEQVADYVVDFIKRYRAEHGLPPMKP
jgi:hypothetical protein